MDELIIFLDQIYILNTNERRKMRTTERKKERVRERRRRREGKKNTTIVKNYKETRWFRKHEVLPIGKICNIKNTQNNGSFIANEFFQSGYTSVTNMFA
jgi:hypothetical protein